LRKRAPRPLDHAVAGGVPGRVLRVSGKQVVVEHSQGDIATYPLDRVEVVDDHENPLAIAETITSNEAPRLIPTSMTRSAGDMSDAGLDVTLAKRSTSVKSMRATPTGAVIEYADGRTEPMGKRGRPWGVIDTPSLVAAGPAAPIDIANTGL
jgi:hypothetical protein